MKGVHALIRVRSFSLPRSAMLSFPLLLEEEKEEEEFFDHFKNDLKRQGASTSVRRLETLHFSDGFHTCDMRGGVELGFRV